MHSISEFLKSFSDYIGAKGCHENEIKEAEESLVLSFSNDYRTYLKEIGLACFNGRELTGITRNNRLNVVDITKENRNKEYNVPKDWYVIEETHIDGIVIWQDSSGTIYATMPNSKPKKIANSLFEYLNNE